MLSMIAWPMESNFQMPVRFTSAPVISAVLRVFDFTFRFAPVLTGDLVESVKMIDEFKHPKTGRLSRAYR